MEMSRSLEFRRKALVLRSTVERARIAAQLAPGARKLAVIDRFTAAARAHPEIAGIAAIGLMAIGPGRLLRWTIRVASIYSLAARVY
jgi:hypothetical protein